MTYDPIDTSASDDSADSTVTIDDIDTTVLQGLNLDDAPAGGEVRITEENGQTVFSAGPLGNVIDNFEAAPDGPYASGETLADYYSGDLGDWSRTTSSVTEGTHALSKDSNNISSFIISQPGDGLPTYPQEGDTIGWIVRDPGSSVAPGVIVAAGAGVDGYLYMFSQDTLKIWRIDNSGYNELVKTSVSLSPGTWFWVESRVPSSGDSTLTMTVYNLNANLTRGTQIASVSATDSTYVSRGIGFGNATDADTGTVIDFLRVL